MKRFALLVAAITVALSQFSATTDAQQHGRHRVQHANHKHGLHHNQNQHHNHNGNFHNQHQQHNHHVNYRVNRVYVRPVVTRQVVQVVPQVAFYGPGHFKFKKRFHTLATKNRLPLEVRWDVDRYLIKYSGKWMGYDSFVSTYCGGNWDWYLSKYRSQYDFSE